jgi:predicted nucleic acid-binding protein
LNARFVCVDASVAVKWALDEDGSRRARELLGDLLETGHSLAVPLHFGSEVANAIYRKQRRGLIPVDHAERLLAAFLNLQINAFGTRPLVTRAFEISVQSDAGAIYDAYYIALAEMLDCDLWTADEALAQAGSGVLGERSRRLADFRPGEAL